MSLIKVTGLALSAVLLSFALREGSKQLALCLTLAAGAMLLLTVLDGVEKVLETLRGLADTAGLSNGMIALIVKLVGMAYVVEFGVQACRDAQAEGMAMKLALCGKVAMLVMTLPLLTELSGLVLSLVP